MADPPPDANRNDAPPPDGLLDTVRRKQHRRQRARREGDRPLAAGLGLFGLVGWSVAVPTVLGIAIGVWIDRRYDGPYSWTLMLMITGVVIGCFNAWYWVRRESERD
ncbi:MAG: AtpZ/AtpI family protein [Trueperaceae bacterium]